MQCPQCGEETPDDEWNCVSCRINLYWASQHLDDLREIRRKKGLSGTAPTPTFLIKAHKDSASERAETESHADDRVRATARKIMKRSS